MSYIWRHETLRIPLLPWMHTALHEWSMSALFPSVNLQFPSAHLVHSHSSSKGRSGPNQPTATPWITLTPFQLRDKGYLQSLVYVACDAIFQQNHWVCAAALELLAMPCTVGAEQAWGCTPAPLHPNSTAPQLHYTTIPLYTSSIAPQFHCTPVPLHPNSNASQFHCTPTH